MFFEFLGINIEGLNSLLFGIQLFIQMYFDRLCEGIEGQESTSEPIDVRKSIKIGKSKAQRMANRLGGPIRKSKKAHKGTRSNI